MGEGGGGGEEKERKLAAMSHEFESRPQYSPGSLLTELSKFDKRIGGKYGISRGTFFQGHRIVALTTVRATI